MVTVAQLIYKDRLWWWPTLCRERCQDCRKPIQEVSFHSQHTHRCLSYICHYFGHLTLFSNPDCQVLSWHLTWFSTHTLWAIWPFCSQSSARSLPFLSTIVYCLNLAAHLVKKVSSEISTEIKQQMDVFMSNDWIFLTAFALLDIIQSFTRERKK